MKRFTTYGSPAFERRLAAELRAMASDFARALSGELRSLVLVGGYGRGEGAVEKRGSHEYPYNDLDLVLILSRFRRSWPSRLEAVRRSWQDRLGLHIDLSRPLTERGVRNWPHRLLWHDVVQGHRVLWGQPDLIESSAPTRLYSPPPRIEASLLLLNRGAGLIEAVRQRLSAAEPDPKDPDFIRRNAFKVDLAMMDAVLLAHGVYLPSLVSRPARLAALSRTEPEVARLDLLEVAERAVRFKHLPSSLSPEVSTESLGRRLERFGEVLCHVESARTGEPRPSLRTVIEDRRIREGVEHRLTRLPINLWRQLQRGRIHWRSPREDLIPRLATLLESSPIRQEPESGRVSDWCRDSEGFYRLWARLT
ncbi:MAG: hypothetical protein MI919_13200 [Holophagales bacterium]|nr:hypothetical protein [Holophagales bacterium]